MTDQSSLFGEPERRPELSQYFTPRWIADRMAAWIGPYETTVLEPSAGGGALVEAALRLGIEAAAITAVELDPRWAQVLRAKFPGVHVRLEDFLRLQTAHRWHTALMNPPYENALHSAFVSHALDLCHVVIALVPSSIEYGAARDAELWASKAMVTRRARLPNRVKFGGDNQASFDSVCLRIVRRNAPRKPDERTAVEEEVWLCP